MKIIFVDEDEDQRETYTLILQSCFAGNDKQIEVVGLEPAPELNEMRFLVQDKDIVSIILDEQLKESGVARYLGIELAAFLRALDKKIPIYILTSYPESEELLDGEFTVEDILNKQDLPNRKDVVGARMLRRIDSYIDIISAREVRFESLLRRSLDEELTDEEMDEFRTLRYLRTAPFEIDEILARDNLERLDALEREIMKLENSLEEKK